MKAGFARVCITPPLGTPMRGYYEKREVKGVLDDLYASAVALEEGGSRAVILALDLCLLSGELCRALSERVSVEAGLPPEAVFINCSHTHTGPTVGSDRVKGFQGSPEYDESLATALCRVTAEALADLTSAELSFGLERAERVTFVRRYRMKDGGVQTNPGVGNPNILHPLGEANDEVKLLRIEREGKCDLALVSFGSHADTVGGELVSADWPGFVRETVERCLPEVKCVFLLGAEGDTNLINPNPTPGERRGLNSEPSFDGCPRGYEFARGIGRRVAAAAIGVFDRAEPLSTEGLSFGTREVRLPSNKENDRLAEARGILELYDSGRADELPYKNMELTTVVAEARRIVGLENGPDSYSFTLSALRLGGFTLVGMPGECFAEIGRRIEEESGLDNLFVLCLTGGGDSYFPTSSAYDEGGYEARSSQLKKGGDRILIDGALALLDELF